MRKNILKLTTLLLVILAFSSALQANAAPTIYVGLTLNYSFTTVDATNDVEVTFDNDTYWTVDILTIYESSVLDDSFGAINKTPSQHTYNFTSYSKETGEKGDSAEGFMIWIDTDGLTIGENITLGLGNCKVIEQIEITIPLGTFSVYNITESYTGFIGYYYYDIVTGFLISTLHPTLDLTRNLVASSSITEFPTFLLPTLVILITLIIVYNKSIKK